MGIGTRHLYDSLVVILICAIFYFLVSEHERNIIYCISIQALKINHLSKILNSFL